MPSPSTNPLKSAIPTVYYVAFGIIEPLVAFLGFLEGISDPNKTLNRHVRGENDSMEVSQVISPTSRVVVCHMVVAYAALGLVNASVLRTIRRLPSHTLQEKIARSLLIPLAVGDVIHQFGSFYGIGDVRWKMKDRPQALRLNAVVGIVLFVTRVCWILGIGRYVAARDSILDGRN